MDIITLLQNDDTKDTVVVSSGYPHRITEIVDNLIKGFVLFDGYAFPITWKDNGFPVLTKDEPEYYYLRLIQRVK